MVSCDESLSEFFEHLNSIRDKSASCEITLSAREAAIDTKSSSVSSGMAASPPLTSTYFTILRLEIGGVSSLRKFPGLTISMSSKKFFSKIGLYLK